MPQKKDGVKYPVLPLRDIVVFPHMIVPLFVGRDKSVNALEDVMMDDKKVLLLAQKNPADDDPKIEDIYDVGTIATVMQLLKLPDGTVKVLVEGGQRARIADYIENDKFNWKLRLYIYEHARIRFGCSEHQNFISALNQRGRTGPRRVL